MIITELYNGQGLGNQLWCYVVTRVIALDHGYDFGIQSPERFKGADFLHLDFGKPVLGGSGPDGGPPFTLPVGITHYYQERALHHPVDGSDIRIFDPHLVHIPDNTKLDGIMQDEHYIAHRKDEIREWFTVDPAYECFDYANDDTCVINFRGGEYARHPELYLRREYWDSAVAHMRTINPSMRFVVITDDIAQAKLFFPSFDVFHFSIGKDYAIIKNAHYLILSNSSFAWFPAWLNQQVCVCIAPKYWARHNVSDGYWSCGYNITDQWLYVDRAGTCTTAEVCRSEFETYVCTHPDYFPKPTGTESYSFTPTTKAHYLQQRLSFYFSKIIEKIKQKIVPLTRKLWIKIRHVLGITWHSLCSTTAPQTISTELRHEIEAYRKTIKIYDCFNFYNELETLEIRLNILNPYVDYFVLVESRLTHSGLPKPLFYETNKDRFKEFNHKILHYVIEHPLESFVDAQTRLKDPKTDPLERSILKQALASDNVPPGATPYLRDFYEKESVRRALAQQHVGPNDFCFVSDLDEIWNPKTLIDYRKDGIFKFRQKVYMYYLNNRCNEAWAGTFAGQYHTLKHRCFNHLRTPSKTTYTYVENGGWHFTFQGGDKRIREKLEAYSAFEMNTGEVKEKISTNLSNNADILSRKYKFWIDEDGLPEYLIEHKARYYTFFKS